MKEFNSLIGKVFNQIKQSDFVYVKQNKTKLDISKIDKFKIVEINGRSYGTCEMNVKWLNKDNKEIILYFLYEELIDLITTNQCLSENCKYINLISNKTI